MSKGFLNPQEPDNLSRSVAYRRDALGKPEEGQHVYFNVPLTFG